jgi:hypothetical protein
MGRSEDREVEQAFQLRARFTAMCPSSAGTASMARIYVRVRTLRTTYPHLEDADDHAGC